MEKCNKDINSRKEADEKKLLMQKVEENKMLSKMNGKYIKHGILKYGSLGVLLIALLEIATAEGQGSVLAGIIIAVISALTCVLATIFRKKYKATMDLLLEEYKIQIHDISKEA